MKRTHAMLLLTYAPRKGIDLDQYHKWLQDVDNPFFNSRPGVKHYSNWRVVEDKLGKSSFTHFDLLYIKDLSSFEEVFGDQAVDEFARGWVRLWGENPNPDAPDQSINYHVYLCEQIAGPEEE
jgi:hypothetical protein